jgi:hypothetical protein
MTFRPSFMSGCHLAAARVMAGLKQTELARLAGIHVNSVKRLEAMTEIRGSTYAVERIGNALLARGVLAERWPMPYVRQA